MKKITSIAVIALLPYVLTAQTLNIIQGEVTYALPAAQAGEMLYDNAETLTAMGKTFNLSEIDMMSVSSVGVADNTVSVVWSGTTAAVTIAGNIAKDLTVRANGSHIRIDQSDNLASEVVYTLSGTSANGSFYTSGNYKATIVLNSLTLTCADSAAVNIHNGKRINLKINGTNTLVDGKNGAQKACLHVKGHPEVSGTGTLTLTGNTAHAFKCNEYMQLKSDFTGTVIAKSAVSDGFHIGQYLEMNGGTLIVQNAGDDGIQIEKTDDVTDEQNGQAVIYGGTVNATITANAAKGLKADSDITVTGGTITITTSGGGVTGTNDTTSACACIKAGGNLTVSDGTFTLKSTGSGGKGISCDGDVTINGGTLSITTTGTRYSSSSSSGNSGWGGGGNNNNSASYKRSSPKGIKADGNITVNGGSISVSTTGQADGSEGIETKNILTINGGVVTVYSYDDAVNSSSHMYIKGGTISVIATNNDGLDANGNLYIQGGSVMAFGGADPECGLDAAEQKYLYITGGNVLAVGGGNNSVTSTTGSQGVLSTNGTVSANTILKVTAANSSTTLASFTIPANYSTPSQGGGRFMPTGPGGGGPGGGGSSGSGMAILISAEGITAGSKYDVYNNSSSATTLTASNTYSGR